MKPVDPALPAVILIVEDEPLLRLFAIDMIEEAGFGVVGAANAADALATLEARPDVRVVFTDVDMPGGLNGIELARRVRERWPLIRIILTSGKLLPSPGAVPAEVAFFPKPYRQDHIIATLQRMAA